MNFYEFYQLLNENTISQELNKLKKYGIDKKLFDTYFEKTKEVSQLNFLFPNISQESVNIITKWMIFTILNDDRNKQQPGKLGDYLSGSGRWNFILSLDSLRDVFVRNRDYLSANIDNNGNLNSQLTSKFNNPQFTPYDLRKLSDRYHEDLKKKQRNMPGRVGKTILSFPSGYSWVDLGRGYCDIESKSMGHCGNQGAKPGDTILSLRDSKNRPNLTFILNNGILGEMKGKQNDKPETKYHPYIIELLKLPIIKGIKGGGYKPENNFQLSDLTAEQLEKLIELKPNFENDFIVEKINNRTHENIDDILTKEEIFKFLKEAKTNIKRHHENVLIIAYHTKNPEVLDKLVEMFYSDFYIMSNVASNEFSTKEVLEKLADHDNLNVKERISTHRSVSIEILKQLSEDEDDNVRVAVATSPILRRFFNSPYFREYSGQAKEILNKLANDKIELVAQTANFALRGSSDPVSAARTKGYYKDVII